MIEDRFDQNIKDRLKDNQELYDGSSWELLSDKLDKSVPVNQEDEHINDDVIDKLLNHEEPVVESHWQLLKAELEELEKRRHRLWAIKLSEGVIILLILFTYFNFNRLTDSNKDEQSVHDNIEYATLETADDFNNVASIIKSEGSPSNTIEITSGINYISGSHDKREVENLAPLSNSIKPLEKSTIEHIELFDYLYKESIEEISSLPIRPFKVALKQFSIPLTSLLYEDKRDDYLSENNGLWFSIAMSQDVNLVNSGLNFGYIKSQVNSGLYGQSVGMMLSYQKKQLEIEGGIRFSDKSYSPGLLRSFSKASIDTYLETRLDRIDFKQLQIPIIAKVHGLNRTKSNLYAYAGIGTNFIVDYDYSLEKSVQPSARVVSLIDDNDVDITELPLGLGEGGSLADNTYFTAILGFGFQSTIKNNTAFFIQPQYQYNFKGDLNYYVRKVHSINIEAGLKFKF